MSSIELTKKRRSSVNTTSPFNQVGVLSSVKEAEVRIDTFCNYTVSRSIPLECSLYVNYIPLSYLCLVNRPESTDEEYINYDEPFMLRTSTYDSRSFEHIGSILTNSGRTIIKSIGSYSLIHDAKPHILACVLPENIVYQKLHILKKGTVDLSRVIIFIDRELGETSFYPPSIRTLYRTELLPKIVQTSCTVFKVPLQFIIDNCFYKENMLPLNIEERRKFKQEALEDFRNSKKENIPVTNARTGLVNTDIISSLPPVTGLFESIAYHLSSV